MLFSVKCAASSVALCGFSLPSCLQCLKTDLRGDNGIRDAWVRGTVGLLLLVGLSPSLASVADAGSG